jgi:hypothetical protein
MITQYRFLRTQNGITSFAIVAVETHPSSVWTVTWNNSAVSYRSTYGTAVEEGVGFAIREHERRGGEPQQVEIMSLVETPADTRFDAVTCAATLSTWKALNHSESEVKVMLEEGEWRITFQHPHE